MLIQPNKSTLLVNNLGAAVLSGSNFGEGTGRILLTGVNCSGQEQQLMNCNSSSRVDSSCTHSQDAAVSCAEGKYITAIITYLYVFLVLVH